MPLSISIFFCEKLQSANLKRRHHTDWWLSLKVSIYDAFDSIVWYRLIFMDGIHRKENRAIGLIATVNFRFNDSLKSAFMGRKEAKQEIPLHKIIMVGTGGVGKSALTLQYMYFLHSKSKGMAILQKIMILLKLIHTVN